MNAEKLHDNVKKVRASKFASANDMDPSEAFGYDVFGPIFTEFALRLWIFQQSIPDREGACLLFCARGGLRLRLIYQRFLAVTGIESPLPYGDLMISRLVAARTCLAAPGSALIDELGREFEGQSMREVAMALAPGLNAVLDAEWDRPFDGAAFQSLIQTEQRASIAFRNEVAIQNDAFIRHLNLASNHRKTIILCDTGLYGSTLRLLQEGVPQKKWIAAQMARSNYKSFATPHFLNLVGISLEKDYYVPWNDRTAALRFWQLIEWILEPKLSSVRSFSEDSMPRSNLEVGDWQTKILPENPGLFSGALQYLDDLEKSDLAQVPSCAEKAWRRLHRTVVWPRYSEIPVLAIADRSRDFGRDQTFSSERIWREAALLRRYRRLGRGALLIFNSAYIARALSRLVRRRHS